MSEPSSAPLGVAVVGAGAIAQMMHLPTLSERPDLFRIEALVDTNEKVLQAVAGRLGVGNCSTALAPVLASSAVEAVLVLHGGSHERSTLEALAAGKHVFSEKPLGYSVEEAEEIQRAHGRTDRVLMVGYQKRFSPSWRRAKAMLEQMEAKRLVEVSVLHPDDRAFHAHHAILPIQAPAEAMAESAEIESLEGFVKTGPLAGHLEALTSPGAPASHRIGALFCAQSLIHDLNLLRDALGEPELVLSAHVWNRGMALQSLVRFPGDVHASLSWVSLPRLKSYDERLRFVGPAERVCLSFPSPYLRHTPARLLRERLDGQGDGAQGLVVEEHVVSHEEAFRAELHHFRASIRERRAPLTGPGDAVADARFIRAIGRAFAGSPVAPV